MLPDARTPGTVNWNHSVLKDATITERFKLQFRVGPDGRNSNADFATITSARDARVIQFALKLLF